ncbi:MAG TPA: thiamine diphosphokinase [Bacteroidales bacterium]|nr:thiamine diphosphokinase [Bacteroidales bacterium]
MKTVILANGSYPSHSVPLKLLEEADLIVCCDGAAEKLTSHGIMPGAIVGDLDSVSPAIKEKYKEVLYPDSDQETNDLTKAVKWCLKRGIKEVTIVGATGLREDHTLANISLMAEYSRDLKVVMYTDTGLFESFDRTATLESYPRQQVSVFSITPETAITSAGLRYPLHGLKLRNWWRGTLNEAADERFSLEFTDGIVIVFRQY